VTTVADLTSHADGVQRVAMPIGVHGIDSVNVYLLPHGDHLTLVDCGVWHPEAAEDDHGLRPLEEGLHRYGYALRDVSRIIVTHAHVDHYGLAGRLMEISGAELWMHTMTDLDCEKYRHPDTAIARRRDMYADHGLTGEELESVSKGLDDWLPYLYSVVEASNRLRGGEQVATGGSTWEVLHTPGHSYGHLCLWSASAKVLISGDHLLPRITPPVTFERGFEHDPLSS
jgi:glyoxylase-like metal-dependent hydrolase (beta-lactamase superfamily II)